MKTTVSLHDFRDAFRKADRTTHFSYEGLEILFDYLEQYEDDCGVEMELDVIAFCCEFSEDDPEYIAGYYSLEVDGLSEEEIAEKVRGFLEDEGAYIGTTESGAIVYRQF